MKKLVKVYLHANKGEVLEQLKDIDEDLNLSEEAESELNYALYEVAIGLMIDTETGKNWIETVDGEYFEKVII